VPQVQLLVLLVLPFAEEVEDEDVQRAVVVGVVVEVLSTSQ